MNATAEGGFFLQLHGQERRAMKIGFLALFLSNYLCEIFPTSMRAGEPAKPLIVGTLDGSRAYWAGYLTASGGIITTPKAVDAIVVRRADIGTPNIFDMTLIPEPILGGDTDSRVYSRWRIQDGRF